MVRTYVVAGGLLLGMRGGVVPDGVITLGWSQESARALIFDHFVDSIYQTTVVNAAGHVGRAYAHVRCVGSAAATLHDPPIRRHVGRQFVAMCWTHR